MISELNTTEINQVSGGYAGPCDPICLYPSAQFGDPNQDFLIDQFFNYKTGLPSIFGPNVD